MRTTKKELQIISAIAELQREGKSQVELNSLAEMIYARGRLLRPRCWQSALAATMRSLGSKVNVSGYGCRLRRTSPIGRGHPGVYEFKGNFSRWLSPSSKPSPTQAQ